MATTNGCHESTPQTYRVIIVGAGIAGLSAARHLVKNGISNVLILEASGKAGGRIHSQSFGNGLVEMGAQWVHGEQNEFCQLVKASNHRHSKTSWEGKGDFLCPDGSKVDSAVVDEVLGWVEDTIEEVESTFTIETLQTGVATADAKASMGSYLQKRFCKYLSDCHPECEEFSPQYKTLMAVFQWAMSFQRIDNSCPHMNDVSLYRWSEFEVNPGEHYNNFSKGAQAFVDEVLVGASEGSSPRIVYNNPVVNIKWDENLAKVSTENGNKYFGEVVLVTLSIGVLKSTMTSLFTPNVPARLAEGIRCTGFGPVTKIFLQWSDPWWPSDLKGFQLIWPNEYLDCCDGESQECLGERWHKTITGFDPVLDNSNTLLAWLGGPEAVYAETLTDEEISNRCVQVLKQFTRYVVPKPEKVTISKWNINKYFQGAYCYRSVEGDKVNGDICGVLCDPINISDGQGGNRPVVFFAGEALSKTHYSTLHGAYESGTSQAGKIVQYFESLANSTTKPLNLAATSKESLCREASSAVMGKNGVKAMS